MCADDGESVPWDDNRKVTPLSAPVVLVALSGGVKSRVHQKRTRFTQVEVSYRTPPFSQPQSVLFRGGYACLGFGLGTSYCQSGAAVDMKTAECIRGLQTVL